MKENNYIVYRHTSPSDKVYIGITSKKPEYRWSNGNGYKDSPKFYNAIKKYGWNNFKHEILFSGLNDISAKMIEEDLIYYYKSLNLSYNISNGGDGTKGVIMSKEARLKMSNAKKGKPSNRKGKHLSEETKEKLRQANLGKHHSGYSKRKMSESHKGQIPWNKGLVGFNKGHIVSEEARRKISENCKGNRGMHWKKDSETGKRIYYK